MPASRGQVFVAAGAAVIAAASVAAAVYHRKKEQERRNFALRYARELHLARKQKRSGGTEASDADTSSISSAISGDLNDTDSFIKVIYGSESGNAAGLAKSLVMTLHDRGVGATLIDPSKWAYMTKYLYQNKNEVSLFSPLSGKGPSASMPTILLFVVATAGEGEAPANFMSLFQEMQLSVRKASSPNGGGACEGAAPPFRDIHYAVFGLGDSSYKYFCRCGTEVNTLMKKGGATNLHRVGFGDARTGLQEDVFEEWQEHVLLALQEKCDIAMTTGTLAPPQPELQFRFLGNGEVVTEERSLGSSSMSPSALYEGANRTMSCETTRSNTSSSVDEQPLSFVPFPPPPALLEPSLMNPARLTLAEKTPLSAVRGTDGSFVCRFAFDTEGTNISYQAGDHLGIFPTNPPALVDRFAALLGVGKDQLETMVELCEIVPSRNIKRNVLPARVPLRVVLERYVDLSGHPKRSALRVLAKYCRSEAEKNAFLELLKPAMAPAEDGSASAVESPTAHLRTVVDYMEKFPSCCCIPLGHFIEVMPRIQPRYYSIASDRLSHRNVVEILVRVLPDGLCTSYLWKTMEEGGEVYGYVRASSFHLPQRISEGRPLLMIGPGTGAAAMVGLCYKRECLMRRKPLEDYGPCLFFFGAQSRETEYFVKDEVERWAMAPVEAQEWDDAHPAAHASLAARNGKSSESPLQGPVVSLLDCAFSRDQEEKVYVTHLLQKHSDEVYKVLTSTAGGGSLVYLSGDASFMAKDVDTMLVGLLQEKGQMSKVEALRFLRAMETEHRYLKDVY